MKKWIICLFVFFYVILLLTSCAPARQTPEPAVSASPSPIPDCIDGTINLYAFSDEVPKMISRYKELHPDFPWEVNATVISTESGIYEPALAEGLESGFVDIYCVESAFAAKYTQGEMSGYAMPYEDLGLDAGSKIWEAGTARYIIDIGTRPSDNALVGLAFQSTAGAFIYRRSIARETWGTDDPAAVALKIGPGWGRFFMAADDLKKKGYCIVSGEGDIWRPIENSADKGWIAGGKLYIDPKREAFLDYSKELTDKGYSNGTQDCTGEWYKDMAGTGKRKVFGFFGPAWMASHVIAAHCGGTAPGEGTYGDWAVCEPTAGFFWGGTWLIVNKDLNDYMKEHVAELIDWITLQCGEDSLQYYLASGTLCDAGGIKDTVASRKVMEDTDGTLGLLGGQDMYDVFIPAGRNVNGNNITQYDVAISTLWRKHVREYSHGKCARDEAIAAFKREVKEQLGIDAL